MEVATNQDICLLASSCNARAHTAELPAYELRPSATSICGCLGSLWRDACAASIDACDHLFFSFQTHWVIETARQGSLHRSITNRKGCATARGSRTACSSLGCIGRCSGLASKWPPVCSRHQNGAPRDLDDLQDQTRCTSTQPWNNALLDWLASRFGRTRCLHTEQCLQSILSACLTGRSVI